MNIVYRIVFPNRKLLGILPNEYIGSKSNCTFKDGIIYCNNGKEYWGSSKSKEYIDAIDNEEKYAEIIFKTEDKSYNNLIKEEYNIQIKYDVVSDPTFFNKSFATRSNYADPSYATYKHSITGKIVRLPRNHPKVISEEYVGVTKGVKYDENRITAMSVAFSGENNPFYGKKHSERSKKLISKKNSGRVKSQEEISNWVEKVAKLPLSEEHKKRLSESNLNKVVLKNIETGECIKIHKDYLHLYDLSIWKNPSSISQRRDTCIYCGKTSVSGNIVRWHNENCKEKNENITY